MKIGLYFGSFNPVHIGHLIIASYILNFSDFKQVWLVVSPLNPEKTSNKLLNEYHRLHLVRLAVEDDTRLRAIDVEFKLPRPSYTCDTLAYLEEQYPHHQFSVIIGADSWNNLPKWKNYEQLIKNYPFVVYKRPGFEVVPYEKASFTILNAPLVEISATAIRKLIQDGKSIRYLVPDKVWEEIEKSGYYKNG